MMKIYKKSNRKYKNTKFGKNYVFITYQFFYNKDLEVSSGRFEGNKGFHLNYLHNNDSSIGSRKKDRDLYLKYPYECI